MYGTLEKYKPKKKYNNNSKYVKPKEKVLINATKFTEGRQIIIDTFKNETFPMTPAGFSEDQEASRDEDKEKKKEW